MLSRLPYSHNEIIANLRLLKYSNLKVHINSKVWNLYSIRRFRATPCQAMGYSMVKHAVIQEIRKQGSQVTLISLLVA